MRRERDSLLVSIRDTGSGIAPDLLPHIFDRFRQGSTSTSRRVGGLGLGLTIVKQLVEMHGGTVGVESSGEGSGSRFRFTLPLVQDALANDDKAAPNFPRGEKILIVDDDEDQRSWLRRVLEDVGAVVEEASSASAAIAKCARFEPGVLLSDISMPGKGRVRIDARTAPQRVDSGAPSVNCSHGTGATAGPKRRVERGISGALCQADRPVATYRQHSESRSEIHSRKVIRSGMASWSGGSRRSQLLPWSRRDRRARSRVVAYHATARHHDPVRRECRSGFAPSLVVTCAHDSGAAAPTLCGSHQASKTISWSELNPHGTGPQTHSPDCRAISTAERAIPSCGTLGPAVRGNSYNEL